MAEQRRGRVDDQRGTELRKLGMPDDQIAAFLAAERLEGDAADDAPLMVWPENWPLLRLFLDLEGQWRVSASGHPQGLRYGEALAVIGLRWDERAEQQHVFDKLLEMQREALDAWEEGASP